MKMLAAGVAGFGATSLLALGAIKVALLSPVLLVAIPVGIGVVAAISGDKGPEPRRPAGWKPTLD